MCVLVFRKYESTRREGRGTSTVLDESTKVVVRMTVSNQRWFGGIARRCR